MKSPITNKPMNIVRQWRTMIFRKEKFKVFSHFYSCTDSGKQFEDDQFAILNYNLLINQYRVKYNIPFPEQIIASRKKYDISAVKMSEILGFGTNIYRQYEKGEVPNQSNAKLIQLIQDPHEFRKLLNLSNSLEDNFVDKINNTIDLLLAKQRQRKFELQLERYYLGADLPSLLTGYRAPNMAKFSEMVIFFIEKLSPFKTKLNKLLFYADFTMYQKAGFSISGTQYRAIQYGPVPNNFQSVFEYLENKKEFDIHYIYFPNGNVGAQFKPHSERVFNSDLFNQQELDVLNEIAKKFRTMSRKNIVKQSHEEKAWVENHKEKKLIDYNYSFSLN